ncbi:hypothetical protein DFH11DRAFT_1879420 [Phellopilus nigrolimitatus]|nr:hypothetical protein DFH11DRAFT_1879420 [Phellopilus nigrolimitatus]
MSHRTLPVSLLDFTVAQARQLAPSSSRSAHHPHIPRADGAAHTMLFRRKAHALALRAKPVVRGGYLHPLVPAPPQPKKRAAARRFIGERDGRPTGVSTGVLRRRSPAPPPLLTRLQDRVEALVAQPLDEVTSASSLPPLRLHPASDRPAVVQTDAPQEAHPHFDEPALRALYADLLAHPEDDVAGEAPRAVAAPPEDWKDVLAGLARRTALVAVPTTHAVPTAPVASAGAPSLAARLASRQAAPPGLVRDAEDDAAGALPFLSSEKTHHVVLGRVTDMVRALEGARRAAGDASASASASAPVALLSPREWDALVYSCIEEGDLEAAEHALDLLRRSGSEVVERLINGVADVYARAGNVPAIEAFFDKFVQENRTERQRDLHIKAHLKSPSPEYNVHSALAVLHNYEGLALLPPMQSYTRCITALFSSRSAQCSAQAWDLFAHMRYVAHPTPDRLLYALMIRACAGTGYWHSAHAAEPARALDLWTEMTQDARHAPSVGTYNAVILACARTREYALDAFRLAKEMLDAHRDAHGRARMQPDRATFAALLVAAKTCGDLPRARWILAEMLSFAERARESGSAAEAALDEKIMMHVFHAYASYVTPFRRGETKIVDAKPVAAVAESDDTSVGEAAVSGKGRAVEELPQMNGKGRFSVTPPQTHAEVLAEARTLFERIVEDTSRGRPDGPGAPPGAFAHVTIDTPLLNSYLSVHYAHGPLEDARRLFHELFPRTGVERSLRTYVEALECCARAAPGHERGVARAFADEVWTAAGDALLGETGAARLVERAFAAMIRVSTLYVRPYALARSQTRKLTPSCVSSADDLDGALALVRRFVAAHPPGAVGAPRPKPAMRASRTALFAARPVVRLTSASEVPDDGVPPLLTFRDLELLHHRLVAAGAARGATVGYLKWVCKTYEGALRRRRDLTIRA